MPKLYIVTINEALGEFFRDIVARTDQINRPEDPAVHVNQIGSISCHLRLDFSERETVSQRLSEQLIFIKQGARTLMQKQGAGFRWSLVDAVEGLWGREPCVPVQNVPISLFASLQSGKAWMVSRRARRSPGWL